jgi:hypothetical protein
MVQPSFFAMASSGWPACSGMLFDQVTMILLEAEIRRASSMVDAAT